MKSQTEVKNDFPEEQPAEIEFVRETTVTDQNLGETIKVEV